MRWLWILLISTPLWAVTPIYVDYPDKYSIYQEFRNFSDNCQDKQFTQVVTSTPALTDIADGNIVIYVSTMNTPTTDIRLILRSGTTLYVSPNFKMIQGR